MAVTKISQQTNHLMIITFQNSTQIISDNAMEDIGLKSQALGFDHDLGLDGQSLTLIVMSSVNSNAVTKMHLCDSSLDCLSIFALECLLFLLLLLLVLISLSIVILLLIVYICFGHLSVKLLPWS